MSKLLDSLNLRLAALREQRDAELERERKRSQDQRARAATAERKREARCKNLVAVELLRLVSAGDDRAVELYRQCRDEVFSDPKHGDGHRGLFARWQGDPLPLPTAPETAAQATAEPALASSAPSAVGS